MINTKPMEIISTPYISYDEIDIKGTDLLEDAWGMNSTYGAVIRFLGEYKPEPGAQLISSLIETVRNNK
jgi:hypothetical protein